MRYAPWLARASALLVIPALLMLAACNTGVSSAPSVSPTATSTGGTSGVTCATALPGASPLNASNLGLLAVNDFPSGTVATSASLTASGVGLFSVYKFTACTTGLSASDLTASISNALASGQHSWITSNTFPADGGLMQSCSAPCYFNPKGGSLYYAVIDIVSDKGNSVITYRVRWAAFDANNFPTCGSNFTGGPPAQQDIYSLPGYSPTVPLPPVSSAVPDDAAGGVRGFDICSPGSTSSINAFMTKELPATGWSQVASDAACIYASECWVNGSAVISWSVSGFPATNWHIAWRQPI